MKWEVGDFIAAAMRKRKRNRERKRDRKRDKKRKREREIKISSGRNTLTVGTLMSWL